MNQSYIIKLKNFSSLNKKRNKFVFIKNNLLFSYKQRREASWCLNKLNKNSSKIRLKNRCKITDQSRSVYKDFGLSRHVVKNSVNNLVFPGIFLKNHK